MSTNTILDEAITNKKTVSFEYNGKNRIVEPHHYGMLTDSLQLQRYQIDGDSNSGGIPEWRNFKLDRIKDIAVNDKIFTIESSYNPSGSNYLSIAKKVEEKP